MTMYLMFGLLVMFLIIINKKVIIEMFGEKNRHIYKLRNAQWFQNHWLAGLYTFGMNAILFFVTALVLYLLTFLLIPYIHLLVMILAVLASLSLWIIINKAWTNEKASRLKMATIGSSFYALLTLLFVYKLVTLEPLYPGEDTFMRAFGLLFMIIVTAVAFVSSFVFLGHSSGEKPIKKFVKLCRVKKIVNR